MSKLLILILLAIISVSLSTVCRDGSSCPGTSTCCLTNVGRVGCCPFENAYCCGDGLKCCPNGYYCVQDGCRPTKNQFLTFLESSDSIKAADLTQSAPAEVPNETASFPSITDLWKCLSEVKPFASDVYDAIQLWRKGDEESKAKAKELLVKIGIEGVSMAKDCYKVIEEILK